MLLLDFARRNVLAFSLQATLADFHQLGLAHADLKPENILLKVPLQQGTLRPLHTTGCP